MCKEQGSALCCTPPWRERTYLQLQQSTGHNDTRFVADDESDLDLGNQTDRFQVKSLCQCIYRHSDTYVRSLFKPQECEPLEHDSSLLSSIDSYAPDWYPLDSKWRTGTTRHRHRTCPLKGHGYNHVNIKLVILIKLYICTQRAEQFFVQGMKHSYGYKT